MFSDELPPSFEDSTVTDVFPRDFAEKLLDEHGVEKCTTDDIYKLGGASSGLSETKNGDVFDYFLTKYKETNPNESEDSFNQKIEVFLSADEYELRLIPPKDAMPLAEYPHRFQVLISAGDLAFVAEMPPLDIARVFPIELPAGTSDEIAKTVYEQFVNSKAPGEKAENYLNGYRVIDALWKKAAAEYDPMSFPSSFDALKEIMDNYVVVGRKLEVTDSAILSNFVFDNNRLPTWVDDFSVPKEKAVDRLEGPGEEYYAAKIVVDQVIRTLESALSTLPADAPEKVRVLEIGKAGDQFRVLCEKLDASFAKALLFPLASKISEQGEDFAAFVRDSVFSAGFGGDGILDVWEAWGLKFNEPDHKKMTRDDALSF